MASDDIECQNLNQAIMEGGNRINSDHENPSSINYLNIVLCAALICIGSLPGVAIMYKRRCTYIGLLAFEPPYLWMIFFNLYKNISFKKHAPLSSKGMEGVYNQISSRKVDKIFDHIEIASWRWLARAGLLISWWVAANLLVPRLKKLTLLGSPVWKWSLLAFTIPAAYFEALYLCLILYLLIDLFHLKIADKYLCLGLYPSASYVVYFGMVLGAWLGYFGTERGLMTASTPNPEAFQYVTWTLVSLLVGSVLWCVKALFLLMWRANAIYRRFEPRILITGVYFLYHGIIFGGFLQRLIMRRMGLLEEYGRQTEPENFSFRKYIIREYPIYKMLMSTTRLRDLSNRKLLRGKQWRKYGLLYPLFSRRSVKKPPAASNLQPEENRDALPVSPKPVDLSPEEYRYNIAKVLYCIVREQYASADNLFTFDDFKKWMVDAHMNCVNMGRTLADATAIVTHLDIFISFLIFITVVLLWLLSTGIATTKVLVTIATPLLALTFIFGDSAKQFFQGIIFCFGIHALDVGDRCILDATELEVKSTGILTTTFIKIGTMEKMMYPNLELATKAIVNLGWQPDPSDTVELALDLATSLNSWEKLEKKIEELVRHIIINLSKTCFKISQ